MIYDCFAFFNELDLLEIRLNELNSVVDKFVLVEAELTHNGDRKPLYFLENRNRFAQFLNKIVHIIVKSEDFIQANNGSSLQERAWMRENIQRNAITRGLRDAKGDDVIIVSDLDEIPRLDKVRATAFALRDGEVIGFALNAYDFYLNLRNASAPIWGNDPKMATMQTFRREITYIASPYCHFVVKAVNSTPTATRFRYIKPTQRIYEAGWHFSYCGGASAVLRKIRAIVENEWTLNMSDCDLMRIIQKRVIDNKMLAGWDRLLPEPLNESFPAYVLANREKFSKLIFQDVPKQGVRIYFLWRWYYLTGCMRRFCMRIIFALTPKWVRTKIKNKWRQHNDI